MPVEENSYWQLFKFLNCSLKRKTMSKKDKIHAAYIDSGGFFGCLESNVPNTSQARQRKKEGKVERVREEMHGAREKGEQKRRHSQQ